MSKQTLTSKAHTVGTIVKWQGTWGFANHAEVLAVMESKDQYNRPVYQYQITYKNGINHFVIKIVPSYEVCPA